MRSEGCVCKEAIESLQVDFLYLSNTHLVPVSLCHGAGMATTTMVVSPLATQSSPKNKRRLFAEARHNSLQKLSIIFDHGHKNGKTRHTKKRGNSVLPLIGNKILLIINLLAF